MASPVPLRKMRSKRSQRQVYAEEEEEEQEQEMESEEERPARRGRRPGKEPVEDEDYEQEEEEEQQQQRKKGRKADGGGAGPASQKRGMRPPRIKPDPDAPRRRGALLPQAQPGAVAAAGEGEGPLEVPARELKELEELMERYTRDAEMVRAKFKANVSRQELEGLVRKVVRHMLFHNSEKPGVPVSRAEVTKLISSSTTQKKHNLTGVVISEAQRRMLEVFGLELREITKAPHRGANKAVAAAAAAGDGTKHLVLRSAVPPSLMAGAVQERGGADDELRGFAVVVMSLVELSGGKLMGAELWPLLEELGVREAAPHPRFGRPADLLEALAKRRYINVERQQGPDGEIRIYTIAENGADEIGSANLKCFYESEFARGGGEEEEEAGAGAGAAAAAAGR